MATRIDKGMYWDRAWSLVEGCSRVSSGCDNCWAAAQTHIRLHQKNPKIAARYAGLTAKNGKFNGKIRLMEDALDLPLRVKKPTRWAVWNDLFHKDVPAEFIGDALRVMAAANQHTFLVLTKRDRRMREEMECQADVYRVNKWFNRKTHTLIPWPLPNVWFGVTVEGPEQLHRIDILRQIPAAVRWVSFEPLLSATPHMVWGGDPGIHVDPGIHWVVIGCESGAKRRPCDIQWVRTLAWDCQMAGVRVFIKQLSINGKVSHDMNEWPPDLRLRQLPGEEV